MIVPKFCVRSRYIDVNFIALESKWRYELLLPRLALLPHCIFLCGQRKALVVGVYQEGKRVKTEARRHRRTCLVFDDKIGEILKKKKGKKRGHTHAAKNTPRNT